MRESASVVFLYRTVPGRLLLKLLVQPCVSRAAGRFLSSGLSGRLVPYYVRRHRISLDEIAVPPGGYPSFNAFFTRKRRAERCEAGEGRLISPCDGFLTPVRIRDGTVFAVKHTGFSLVDLLGDEECAEQFRDGTALIFRLTPADYHRYCYAADGRVILSRRIPGRLHCVRPVALRSFPVFAQNSREYQLIRTEEFGPMVQMEIGALLVGKIRNHRPASGSGRVSAGEEKGYFEFGGSTIVLLLRKDAALLCSGLRGRKNENGEIPVRRGECVAVRPAGKTEM